MEGYKIHVSGRDVLLTLGILLLCLGDYTVRASSVNESSIYYDKEIRVNSWGGTSGAAFTFHFIKEFNVTYSTESLESIGLKSEDGKTMILGGGYTRPVNKQTFTLGATEYLTGFSGTIGVTNTWTVVKSITFYTSERVIGPYGPNIGSPFYYKTSGGIVTGFHGRRGNLVVSLGIYVKPFCKDFNSGSSLNLSA